MPKKPQQSTIPLPHVPTELRRRGHPITYATLYKAVLNGQVPAHQVNGRWLVNADDIGAIADVLALPYAA